MLLVVEMQRLVVFLYMMAAAMAGACSAQDSLVSVADESPGTGVEEDGSAGVSVSVDAFASTCGVPPGATWKRCLNNPLVQGMRPAVEAGKLEWTQADPTVLYDPTDRLWKAWWSTVVFTSCATVTSQREIHIKYAESNDGISWRVQAEPVLRSHRAAGDWDYSTVETPTVIRLPTAPAIRRFAMIYAGGNDAALAVLGQTGWQLGVAFSPDGKHFTRIPAYESPYVGRPTPFSNIEGLALLASDAFPGVAGVHRGIVADPEVIAYGGAFHLYFSSVAVDAAGAYIPNTYGISHATSTDLVHWTAATGNPIPALWGGGQPAILVEGNQLTMYFGQDSEADRALIPSALFSTLGFWKATSSNGTTWTRTSSTTRDFSWLPTDSSENLGLINGAAVARGPDALVRLYYSAWGTRTQPASSCVFVWNRATTPPQLASVPGTHNLLLSIRR